VRGHTSVIDQIRGFLLERGITFSRGPAKLRSQIATILEDADTNLTPCVRNLLDHLWQEWKPLEVDIATVSKDIDTIANDDPACQRLLQIPGIRLKQDAGVGDADLDQIKKELESVRRSLPRECQLTQTAISQLGFD
jgi:transposase